MESTAPISAGRAATGERLRRARKAQGATLKDLAEAGGFSETYAWQVEHGHQPGSERFWAAVRERLQIPAAQIRGEV